MAEGTRSRADQARHEQLARETDRIVNQRPSEAPRGQLDAQDPRGPHFWPCPASLGRRHDISMKKFGGGDRVCWYCGKSKAQLLAARASAAA